MLVKNMRDMDRYFEILELEPGAVGTADADGLANFKSIIRGPICPTPAEVGH